MTAVSALLLALITGWMVPAARLAMAAFLGPWLVAQIYQTADIGLGYAVSPPQTVTQFPRVIGYVVVTDHAVLVWPESTAHHTTNPSPPLFGILSIALCLIGIAVLGTAVLRRRAAARLSDQGTRTAG
jgi:small-conductance mechanosensitive channel